MSLSVKFPGHYKCYGGFYPIGFETQYGVVTFGGAWGLPLFVLKADVKKAFDRVSVGSIATEVGGRRGSQSHYARVPGH